MNNTEEYKGRRNCKYQPEPIQTCDWIKHKKEVYRVCPMWELKKDKGGGTMERLTNTGTNGEIRITDNDETRRFGRKESAYKKLAEYEDLDEQGLLLRLPVPIGTTVYKFEPLAKETERYIKTTITRYEVFGDSIWFTFANGLGRNIEDFGKYVFLTQAEAEQKLRKCLNRRTIS